MKKGCLIPLSLLGGVFMLIAIIIFDLRATNQRGQTYKKYHFFSYYLNTSPIIKAVPRISSDYQFYGDGIIDRGFRSGGVIFCSIADWDDAYRQLKQYTNSLNIPVYYDQPKWRDDEQSLDIYTYNNCLNITLSEYIY